MQGFALTFCNAAQMLETLHRGLNFDLSGVCTDPTSQPQSCKLQKYSTASKDKNRSIGQPHKRPVQV